MKTNPSNEFDNYNAFDSPTATTIHQQGQPTTPSSSSSSLTELLLVASPAFLGLLITMIPEAAHAATSSDPISNALVAYGHYLALFIATSLLAYERTTVRANMDPETEKNLVKADATYGITALSVAITGYYRIVEYGKGWEFYSHEPVFWLKLTLVGLWASLSLFPTITLVQRGIPLFQGDETVAPMSEALAKRMKQVITAEISALWTIPITASLMARGVSYNPEFPWTIGAAIATIVTLGTTVLYSTQALNWKEEE